MSYDGYIYCFSNPLMPGILKVGMTERNPAVRLDEANSTDTWRPPLPYKIEFAKKVFDVKDKEATLHILMDTHRIHPRREFFRISIDKVRRLFDQFDGEMWNNVQPKPQPKIPRALRELQDYLNAPKKS